jgi:prepilin-type processing-associated H-X9-DG protein
MQSWFAPYPPTPAEDNWRMWFPSVNYNVLIGGTIAYTGQPKVTCPNGSVVNGPARLPIMRRPAEIFVLLHNAGPYQAEPNYHIWDSSDGMYNTPPGGCRPYEDCREWQKSMQPHTDGSHILFADGHVKWYSRKSKMHGWGEYGANSAEYLSHWIPTS